MVGRVVGALDNVSAALPGSVRDRVTSNDRRESAENATDAGARASNFKLPEEKAKVVEKHVAQSQEATRHEQHNQPEPSSHAGAGSQVRRLACSCPIFLIRQLFLVLLARTALAATASCIGCTIQF